MHQLKQRINIKRWFGGGNIKLPVHQRVLISQSESSIQADHGIRRYRNKGDLAVIRLSSC